CVTSLLDRHVRHRAPHSFPTRRSSDLIRASVTDAVEELLDELPRVERITFRALTAALVDRLEVVVRFLAVLELYKQGLIELGQRSEEHTSELQSRFDLVCRPLLEQKKT